MRGNKASYAAKKEDKPTVPQKSLHPGRFFGETEKVVFVARPNRFTILGDLGGQRIRAFLPNPGRMRELLLPGAPVFVERAEKGKGTRRLGWTAVAVERDGHPVVVHTHRANAVARRLIEKGWVPGLEGARVVGEEVAAGRSRFDFLLARGGRKILLEVKSCTLFGRRVAMFPDAVTERGRRHVEELGALAGGPVECAVLFLVHSPKALFFLPEFHTDPAFSRALCEARERIGVIPLALTWSKELTLGDRPRLLEVPWQVVARESGDRGCYLLILRLRRKASFSARGLGETVIPPGFYVYAGSARKNLDARIARHRRRRKRFFWHIDRLREVADFHAALPLRTAEDLECRLARAVAEAGASEIPGFGCSDCRCSSHLFHMPGDPLDTRPFHEMLQYFRMDRLVEGLST